jgi:GTP 3',8-cyclase
MSVDPSERLGEPPLAPPGVEVVDSYGRPLRSLRVSVTDRCNLRCQYCMPAEDYAWLARESVLEFDEIVRLVDVFVALGVDKIRLTGGEPLLRPRVADLVRELALRPGIRDLAMTTNGVRLAEQAEALRAAGLRRVTVSLDTLVHERFRALARRDSLDQVLEGIASLGPAGFAGTKIDTVVVRGVNDDELLDVLEFGRQVSAEVRFIEYMDVGGATLWSAERVVGRDEILDVVTRRYGSVHRVLDGDPSAPATRFALPDGTVFGTVASMTRPFCRTCDRARLTADGLLYRCLYGLSGSDLRTPLRDGATDEELRELVVADWHDRTDRGAESRHKSGRSRPFISLTSLKRDPHLEMHTRGG